MSLSKPSAPSCFCRTGPCLVLAGVSAIHVVPRRSNDLQSASTHEGSPTASSSEWDTRLPESPPPLSWWYSPLLAREPHFWLSARLTEPPHGRPLVLRSRTLSTRRHRHARRRESQSVDGELQAGRAVIAPPPACSLLTEVGTAVSRSIREDVLRRLRRIGGLQHTFLSARPASQTGPHGSASSPVVGTANPGRVVCT